MTKAIITFNFCYCVKYAL